MLDYALGLAAGLVNALRHRLRGYRTPVPSGTNMQRHSRAVVDRWAQHVAFDGKRVLEVGPGADLSTGALMRERGAVSYTAVDLFPLAEPRADVATYIVTSFPDLPGLTGEFDLIVSNATLEHIADVPALFARLAEVSAPGCEWCHFVDAKTHMRWIKKRDPLNLLRYPDLVYKLMSFPGVPNRLRASDYEAAAAASGFASNVHAGKTADPAYVDQLRTVRPYDRRDLELLSFMVVSHR